MRKGKFNHLFKCLTFGVLLGILAILVSVLTTITTGYYLNEVLFMVGIIMIGIGLISLVGGEPMGLSLNGLGSQSAQYTSNSNLETSRREGEMGVNNRKIMMKIGKKSLSIIIGGVIPAITSFII